MLKWLLILFGVMRSAIHPRQELVLENLALRQQLAVWKQRYPRLSLKNSDRLFWVFLSRVWSNWQTSLHLVKPATVVRWHRQGFKYYWCWKSRCRGRPKIDPKLRILIRQMCQANPLWGTANTRRTLNVGIRFIRSHCLQIYDSSPRPTLADLANLFTQSHEGNSIARFFHDTDCDVQSLIRVFGAQ